MILQSLARLAEREGLIENADYETKELHWAVTIDARGRWTGLDTLLQPSPPSGRKSAGPPRGLSSLVPRPFPGARASGVTPDAGFLVGNASFLLGIDLTDEQKYAGRTGELGRRLAQFRGLVEEAKRATGDAGLAAVAEFLCDTDALRDAGAAARQRAESGELKTNHLLGFSLQGDGAPFVHVRPAVQSYWCAFRTSRAATEAQRQCLVTGVRGPTVDKHPAINRLPGGGTAGVKLVSFNSSAFESYGFARNQNAPVSRRAAEAYTAALNRLLASGWPNPRDPNERLPEQRVVLSDDTVAVFWTDESSRVPAAIVPAVAEGDPEAAAALGVQVELDASYEAVPDTEEQPPSAEPLRSAHEAPWKGIAPQELEDPGAFRLLILSGGQGRATVRAFHTSSVREVVAGVRRWFDDVHVSTLHGRVPLGRLLSSLALRGDRKKLPPNLAAEMFLAVIEDRPLPFAVLEAAVRRCRSEANTKEVQGRAMHDLKVTPARVALIKAWFNRALRNPALRSQLQGQQVVCEEVMPSMNQDERNKGYLLGRMFACVERMQELALGDVGASVTDRYFSAACATPQAVFPRLLKIEVHHFGKAKESARGATARWLHGQIGQLAAWLVGGINGLQPGETLEAFQKRTGSRPLRGFPAFMPLPEQGLFALGYHQQRAEFFTRRSAPSTDPASESENAGPLVAE